MVRYSFVFDIFYKIIAINEFLFAQANDLTAILNKSLKKAAHVGRSFWTKFLPLDPLSHFGKISYHLGFLLIHIGRSSHFSLR